MKSLESSCCTESHHKGAHGVVVAEQQLPHWRLTLYDTYCRFIAQNVFLELDYAGGGAGKGAKVSLLVDGKEVASGQIEATVAGRFGVDTFGVGVDSGQPVTFAYKPPFAFNATIKKVTISLGESSHFATAQTPCRCAPV